MIGKITKTNNSTLRQYAVVILANLSSLSVGFIAVWSSPVLVKLSDANNLVLDRTITATEGSWIISSILIGSAIMIPVVPYLADNFGRKACIVFSAISTIIGFIILTFAERVWMVIVGRFVSAFLIQCVINCTPMYTSEIASKEIRGALGSICSIMTGISQVMILCIGPFLSYFTLNAVLLVVVILAPVPFLFMPDSPYILHKQGKVKEAHKFLTFLRDSTSQACEEMKEYELNKNDDQMSFTAMIKSRNILKSMGIVAFLGIGHEICGQPFVILYLQTILESTDSSISSDVASLVIGFVQCFSTFITILVIDRFGRKPLLSGSMCGVAAGMIGLGTFFTLLESGYAVNGFMNYLPLVSIILSTTCYTIGVSSLLGPLVSELFDGRARATGLSLFNMASMISVFSLNVSIIPIIAVIGVANLYWIFGMVSIGVVVFVVFCVPETKGKTFSEIQINLGRNKCGEP